LITETHKYLNSPKPLPKSKQKYAWYDLLQITLKYDILGINKIGNICTV